MARSTNPNSWEGISRLANAAGAMYPELVSAQWALESAWGTAYSGENNPFGLKGTGRVCKTKEVVNGEEISIEAEFLSFESLEDAVKYLVNHWYKDFISSSGKRYQGVNHADNRELAAKELVMQHYATDPDYAKKLIALMRDHEPAVIKAKSDAPPLLVIQAKQDTWLKKRPVDSTELGDKDMVAVAKGRAYDIRMIKELAGDAHEWVELAHAAGSWFVFGPHWDKQRELAQGTPPPSVDWGDFNCRVTEHLTVGEILQFDARRKPAPGSGAVVRILKTAAEFEKIRAAWNGPLGVTSYYRPEPVNKEVGGVPGSRHVTGEAIDLYPTNRSLESFYQWIRQRWTGGLGDGRHKGFVHLDTRNGGHFVPGAGVRPYAEWTY